MVICSLDGRVVWIFLENLVLFQMNFWIWKKSSFEIGFHRYLFDSLRFPVVRTSFNEEKNLVRKKCVALTTSHGHSINVNQIESFAKIKETVGYCHALFDIRNIKMPYFMRMPFKRVASRKELSSKRLKRTPTQSNCRSRNK